MKRLILLFIIPFLFLLLLRESTLAPGVENSNDVFYHIAMADFGANIYMGKELPFMTMSFWEHNFSDKELMFHFILNGIRNIESFLKLNMGAPFHPEYIIFMTLIIAVFIAILYHFSIKHKFVYMAAFVTISPFFTTRILMLRPHLLSIFLMLLSLIIFDRIKEKRHLLIAFLFGCLMSYSYSNPHFILFPASAFALIKLKKDFRLALLIPFVTLLGLIIGYIIHPQFPNTFVNWKIQCVDVILQSLYAQNAVGLGDELGHGSLAFFIKNSFYFILFLSNGYLFWRYTKGEKITELESPAIPLFLLSLLFGVGSIVSMRAMEYSVPFVILTTALLMKELDKKGISVFDKLSTLEPVWRKRVLVGSILFLFISSGIIYSISPDRFRRRAFTQFADWIHKRPKQFPKGMIIGNINWSDLPLLIYALPEFRFLSGVDPMFSYYRSPENMNKIELFRQGRMGLSFEELYKITKTRYIFLAKYNYKLVQAMYKMGFVGIYQGEDGDLFDLALSLHMKKKKQKSTLNMFHGNKKDEDHKNRERN